MVMELKVETFSGTIGVAVSGGADSMALLHAFCVAKQNIIVVNVEHGIRGDASIRDTDFVRSYCKLNHIPFISRSVSTLNSALNGESVETCARRLRYEFFEELLASGKVEKIALAHHADDNAETVLMRIFRGTGLRGLIGINNRDKYIRPLVSYTRKQIEEYIAQHRIPFVTDETNLSSEYTRNYVRNELMPLINARFNDVPSAITRLSECAKEADDYLSSVCPKAEKRGNEFYLKNIFEYPKILQKYAIMQTIREMGFLQDFENRHVESVCELIDKPNNTSLDLPFNLTCIKYQNGIIITQADNSIFCEQPFAEETVYAYKGSRFVFRKGTGIIKGISLDAEQLPSGCVVRTRKDGDVFKRVNGKRKLLSDYLNGEKMTKTEKNRLLVLAYDNEVYAVLGKETSDLVKITDKTVKILHILREQN